LLYGKTADVVSAKKNGVLISLGSDWTPTGSKNLLWELKVADLYNRNSLGRILSDLELAEMVTLNPAKAIGVADQIGNIKPGLFADFAIFEILNQDPYRNLMECTEKNLILSIISGRPRYGAVAILSKMGISNFEKLNVGSLVKGIDILEPGVEYGDFTFAHVWSNLSEALAHPENTAKKLFDRSKMVSPNQKPPLRLMIEGEDEDVDNRLELSPNMTYESFLQTNFETDVLPALVLDSLTMYDDEDFFVSLRANPNIPSFMSDLKNYLN
jgi:hypothetical protein